MPINLVSLVMQFLTPNMVGRIASALGIDRNLLQTAISAAVPSLLAGFSKVATQPGGPQKLADAATQHAATLDSFVSMLGAGSQSLFIERGSQMLSSLLGGRDQNALLGAISKFTAMSQGAAGPLLGILGPVVMGTIAQQQGATRALDPSKIAGLLASQKENIAAAMPPGLGNLLSSTGLLDSLGGAARTATAVGSEAARVSAPAARDVIDTGRRLAASASNNWLYWLIPAAAVAALLLYVLARPTDQFVQQGVQQATTGVQSAMVGGLDVGKQVTDSLSGLGTTLAAITDAASAQAALPKLQQTVTQIDKISELNEQLSTDQRSFIAALVSKEMASLNQLFDKVLAVPGISDELKPVVETLRAKLKVLAT